jgi:hypothetical protein
MKVPPSESHFLEAEFFMYHGTEWSSSPAYYVGVQCQMSPFQQTVLGHNGQGGKAIPWHEGLGWQIPSYITEKMSCLADTFLVTIFECMVI